MQTADHTTLPPTKQLTKQGSNIFNYLFGSLQSIGRSLMLPVAVLPAAALLSRLGHPDLLNISWMAAAGDTVFANLSMIFAVGIAVGLTGGEGTAAVAALIGYLIFNSVFDSLIPQIDGKPDTVDVNMGVLSGIIVGVIAANLYQRFHDIKFPDYLGFFSGRRFVPIVTALVTMILGAVFGLIWPHIQNGINSVNTYVAAMGASGAALYGFGNRLLIPFGLHHVLNTYIFYEVGSYSGPFGIIHGDQTRYFAGDPTAGGFMAGFFPIMMFGLPAACLAMIRQARFPKVAAGILVSAALASFLTGVTEPIEFAFLFVAPVLFFVHALLTGTSLFICYALNIKIGFGFSAGLIDYLLNFPKSNTSNPLLILPIGLVYALLYYVIFSFFIRHFNLATPGRGDVTLANSKVAENQALPDEIKTKRPAASKDEILALQILTALGGSANLQSVEGCITRLRLFVNNPELLDETQLKQLGASGVIKRGKIVQVVMGTQSDFIAESIKKLIKSNKRTITDMNKFEDF